MPRAEKVSILIADDHAVVRRGLRMLLRLQPGWKVCSESGSGSEAIRKAMRLKPDVAVLDISMPDMNGLEAAREIHRSSPQTKILMLTMHYSEEFVREAMRAGARGYIVKSDAEADLIAAIGVLRNGGTFFSNTAADVFLGARAIPPAGGDEVGPESLTRRELQVLKLIADGKTNKQLATELGISRRTAENHRASIMSKLQLRSVSQLVRFALRHKLIVP